MDPMDVGLFNLADKRLSWLDKRQEVLAQNIANADTPKYQAKDLKSFDIALAEAGYSSPVQTNVLHMTGVSGGMLQEDIASRPHERSPDGNAVGLDGELGKVAGTESAQTLVINIYHKYLSLFRQALGHG